jgi:hypothetical protein
MYFGNFEVSERTINVVITGEESVVWDNTVRNGTIKDIFYKYTCVLNGQCMVLLHAWGVTFGTILSEIGQCKTFFLNIVLTKMDNMVLLWDNIRRFF